MLQGDLASFQYLKGGYKTAGEGLLEGQVVTEEGNIALR